MQLLATVTWNRFHINSRLHQIAILAPWSIRAGSCQKLKQFRMFSDQSIQCIWEWTDSETNEFPGMHFKRFVSAKQNLIFQKIWLKFNNESCEAQTIQTHSPFALHCTHDTHRCEILHLQKNYKRFAKCQLKKTKQSFINQRIKKQSFIINSVIIHHKFFHPCKIKILI